MPFKLERLLEALGVATLPGDWSVLAEPVDEAAAPPPAPSPPPNVVFLDDFRPPRHPSYGDRPLGA